MLPLSVFNAVWSAVDANWTAIDDVRICCQCRLHVLSMSRWLAVNVLEREVVYDVEAV